MKLLKWLLMAFTLPTFTGVLIQLANIKPESSLVIPIVILNCVVCAWWGNKCAEWYNKEAK